MALELSERTRVVGADLVELAPIAGLHACDYTAAAIGYKLLAYALGRCPMRWAASGRLGRVCLSRMPARPRTAAAFASGWDRCVHSSCRSSVGRDW